MAGQGVATGKISLAVELIDNYKQIANQLKNGLKGNLKDYELDVGFKDENLAKQAEEELNKINKMLSSNQLQKLDWSNVIPPLTQVLSNNDLADDIKVQIIEGFRKGIEELPYYYNELFTKTGATKWEKIKPGEEIAQQLFGSSVFNEAIESFDMGKKDIERFKKQYMNSLGQNPDKVVQDIIQMMSNVTIGKDNKDLLPYMLGGNASSFQLEELWLKAQNTTDKFYRPDLRRAAALTERLKYIASKTQKDKDINTYADAEKKLEEIIELVTNQEKGGKYSQEDVSSIIGNIRERIASASEERDSIYNQLNPQQYRQKDIPLLLERLREMIQGERSKRVKSVIDQYDKPNTIDWKQIFQIGLEGEDEPIDLSQDEDFNNFLESFVNQVVDQRTEEKKIEDEKKRKNAQIAQAFKTLLATYGKTGINSNIENISELIDPSLFTDKLAEDVDHLSEQRQEVEKQANELKTAKEELEKENTAIVDVINGDYSQKGVKLSKKQLLEKQQAYDEADESHKDLAWVEYYKAYQNMIKEGNMPKKLGNTWNGESLEERLAKDFGADKEFNSTNLREHLINLKQKWIENSTALQDMMQSIAEFEIQKKLIEERINNLQTTSKDNKGVSESGETSKDYLISFWQHKIDTVKDQKNQIEKQQEELNNLLESLEGDEESFDPNVLLESENEAIADWANNIQYDGFELSIERVREYNAELEEEVIRLEDELQKYQNNLNNIKEKVKETQEKSTPSQTGTSQQDNQPAQQQADANNALGESAGQAAGAVNGLTEAQRENAQTGQQAGETAQNAATAMREETDAANADADAQDRLATSRQNARDAQAPSTPSNPTPAPTPETPPTHPETPVKTGDVKGMNDEADAAENARFKFMSAADAKKAFVDANKDANASAEETAKSIDKESQAAENVKLGFDPERLQNAIDTTQKIHELLTQVSTAISQMDKNSDTTGIITQLTKVAEAMGLIVESAQQVGNAMSAIQSEDGLKIDLQNGLDINPLVAQFETLNEKVIALVASLGSMQSAIGAVDDNSGLPNILSQIQNIANSLSTISQKDFGINFNIKSPDEGMNPFEKSAAEGIQKRKVIKQLEQQYNVLARSLNEKLGIPPELTQAEDFWAEMVSSYYNYAPDEKTFSQIFSENFNNATKGKSLIGRIDAYSSLIDNLKQMLSVEGVDVESLIAPYSTVVNEFNEQMSKTPSSISTNISDQIKQMFGSDNSGVLNDILNKIQEITNQLDNLNSTLSSLSDGSSLIGLKESFEQIPQKIEEATQKILELKQQIDTAQFSAGFDEQFKGLTEQLKAAKEGAKATNEELTKTKKLLDEEIQARKQLQSEVDKHKTQDANDQRKANAEEKKALEAEKKNLEKQLADERQKNENRTKAVEAQNQAYLNKELERKKAIELEQMKAAEREEQARQKAMADQIKAQQAAAKAAEKAQINKEDTSLSTDYGRYTKDVKEMFDATTVEQYNTALQHTLDTEARIRSAREQSVLTHGTSDQILQQAAGLSDTTLGGGFVEGFEKAQQAQLNALRAIETARTAFVEKQQSSMDALSNQLQSINIQIAPEIVSGWGDAQQAEYQKITDGANLASIAIESLNRMLNEMRSGQFDFTDQASMETFLTLKNAIPDLVQETQQSEKTFATNITTSVKDATAQLDNAQKKLESIKDSSKDFIVVDDNLTVALEEIETHLDKIKNLKEILNNSPLSILNKDFSTNLTNYLNQLNGTENQAGIIDEAQGYYNHSKADFNKISSYFSNYATAINGLFSELNKGADVSFEQLEEKLKIVDYYAQRIKETTGLERDQILNIDPLRDTTATQAMIDAQESARGKISSAYEKNLTDIQNKIDSTKESLNNLFVDFDTIGLDKLNENYAGDGTAFDGFVKSAENATQALNKLQEIRDKAKGDPLFFQDKNNLEEYHKLLEELEQDIKTVSKGASDFRVVNPNDIQKARAEMAKFLRVPGLTGEEKSQIQDFYSQMQEGINKVTFDNIIDGFNNIKNKAEEAGHTGDTFFSMLAQRFKSLGAYLLSFVSFYRVIGVFKDGINIIHELDDALTEMQKVSDESLSSLQEYQRTTFDTANKIGTTAAQLQQSTADWMRLGEDLQTASQSAQTANVLFNVSEFDSIDEATTALVAMSAAYTDAEKDIDKMDIVDRLNLIGNNYAIATDELATALQDGAATLQTAGNDLDQAIALTTAGNIKIA